MFVKTHAKKSLEQIMYRKELTINPLVPRVQQRKIRNFKIDF